MVTFDRDRQTGERDNRFRRKESKGRIAKRRSFVLQASWGELNATLPQHDHAAPVIQTRHASRGTPSQRQQPTSSLQVSALAQPKPTQTQHGLVHSTSASATWVSTLTPSHARKRRGGIAKKQGSGRSTQLRSFTLKLTLPAAPSPAPSPAPTPAPTPMPTPLPSPARQLSAQATPQPACSPHIPHTQLWAGSSQTPSLARSGSLSTTQTPGFAFTPMEGVPERQLPNRRPATQRPSHAQPTPSKPSPKPSFTPVEGVPEKALALAATSSRLACLARMRAWGPAGTPLASCPEERLPEGDFIRRADDAVLKSTSASPEPGGSAGRGSVGQLHMAPAEGVAGQLAGATSQPSTPFQEGLACGHVQLREMAVQTGISLRNGQASSGSARAGRGQDAGAADDEGGFADQAGVCDGYEHGGQEQEQLPAEDEGMQLDDQQLPAPAEEEAGPSNQEMEPALPAAKAATGGSRARRSVGGRELEAMQRRKSLAGDGLVDDVHDGTRRSTRSHQRPLEYWRNECKVFGRDHRSLPTVVRVQMRTPNPSWPLPTPHAKGNPKRRARTK